ncbi:hypothetical protein FOZ62_015471, partial [Perkinsus olseni]
MFNAPNKIRITSTDQRTLSPAIAAVREALQAPQVWKDVLKEDSLYGRSIEFKLEDWPFLRKPVGSNAVLVTSILLNVVNAMASVGLSLKACLNLARHRSVMGGLSVLYLGKGSRSVPLMRVCRRDKRAPEGGIESWRQLFFPVMDQPAGSVGEGAGKGGFDL